MAKENCKLCPRGLNVQEPKLPCILFLRLDEHEDVIRRRVRPRSAAFLVQPLLHTQS
jgi:hypothetical protein